MTSDPSSNGRAPAEELLVDGDEAPAPAPRFGNLGKPGDALLACPACLLVAVPVVVRPLVWACAGCRARVAVFRRSNDGRGQPSEVREVQPAPRPVRNAGPVPVVPRRKVARGDGGPDRQAGLDLAGDGAPGPGPGSGADV